MRGPYADDGSKAMIDFLAIIQQVLSYYEGDITLTILVYIVLFLIGLVLPATDL
ncbi:MAG: hypothetical protein HUU46_12745 [Candidatus Hydrogenedentes bacterium]|nr:hypothetical protein [Candidatus Hydrogenedentota bacterium]